MATEISSMKHFFYKFKFLFSFGIQAKVKFWNSVPAAIAMLNYDIINTDK